MTDLHTTSDLVKAILESKPYTRNSDNALYLEVLKFYEFQNDTIILHQSVEFFLNHMNMYGVPSIETIGRCRRKVQELHPELRASEPVEAERTKLVGDFKSFSREGAV